MFWRTGGCCFLPFTLGSLGVFGWVAGCFAGWLILWFCLFVFLWWLVLVILWFLRWGGLVVRVFLLVMLLSGLVVAFVFWVLGGSCMWRCSLWVWGVGLFEFGLPVGRRVATCCLIVGLWFVVGFGFCRVV